jgi:UDP-glucose 4-epimerase
MKLAGKNVMITGGAGFIGSNLVDRIISENPAKILVVDNFFLGKEENLEDARKVCPDIKISRMDASDLGSMRELVDLEKIEVVFNLAVIPLPTSLQFPGWTVNTNVEIATTFCELARWGCIQTLVHTSSSEAYGSARYVPMDEAHPLESSTPYAASKAAADLIVLSYFLTFGIDTVIVRPFNNFGPRQNAGSYAGILPIIIQRVKKGLPIEIYGDGEQTRDYVFVRRTVDAFVKIYEQEATRGKALNIATGQEITINRLVAEMLEVLGVPNHPVIHCEERPGDVRRHCGNVQLAERLIGFQPEPISRSQLEETVEWYLKRLR